MYKEGNLIYTFNKNTYQAGVIPGLHQYVSLDIKTVGVLKIPQCE